MPRTLQVQIVGDTATIAELGDRVKESMRIENREKLINAKAEIDALMKAPIDGSTERDHLAELSTALTTAREAADLLWYLAPVPDGDRDA